MSSDWSIAVGMITQKTYFIIQLTVSIKILILTKYRKYIIYCFLIQVQLDGEVISI